MSLIRIKNNNWFVVFFAESRTVRIAHFCLTEVFLQHFVVVISREGNEREILNSKCVCVNLNISMFIAAKHN